MMRSEFGVCTYVKQVSAHCQQKHTKKVAAALSFPLVILHSYFYVCGSVNLIISPGPVWGQPRVLPVMGITTTRRPLSYLSKPTESCVTPELVAQYLVGEGGSNHFPKICKGHKRHKVVRSSINWQATSIKQLFLILPRRQELTSETIAARLHSQTSQTLFWIYFIHPSWIPISS